MAKTATPTDTETDLEIGEGLELFERMHLIRQFEQTVQRLFQKGEVHGTTHLYIGQEAGATGVASALTVGDRAAGTYRGHGHALAMGVEPQALLDEMLGRASGVCGGRAGSMNVIDLEHGLIGCFGIVGGSIAAATGAGLALKRQGAGKVAVAFFGEGTSNQAYFAECLNLAAVLELPVVFVCENNLYMEFTPIEDVTAGDISARASTLGLWTKTVDGMDVWAVRSAAREAVEHARGGNGPAFLQTLTYRFVGHSRSDPGAYRRPGELDTWRLRDPLVVARERLLALGVEAGRLDEIEQGVVDQMAQVAERSLAAPYPDPSIPVSEFRDSGPATDA
jgi:acetoin:2,6-dichlorophenolindophenol oxidoreductase subunit alpha